MANDKQNKNSTTRVDNSGALILCGMIIALAIVLNSFGGDYPYDGVLRNTSGNDIIYQSNVQTMDVHVRKLSEGKIFKGSHAVVVGAGTTTYTTGCTGNHSINLFRRSVYAETTGNSLDYLVLVYENATNTGLSGNVTNRNNNRDYGYTDGFGDGSGSFTISTIVSGVNLTGSKPLPWGIKVIDDKKFSDLLITDAEYILTANTCYYLGITNNDGGDLTVIFGWEWYEED